MRIVSIGETSVCRHYRSIAPMQALQALGHDVTLLGEPPNDGTFNMSTLADSDVILGYRQLYAHKNVLQRCIASGSAFVWDTDDDLAAMPPGSPFAKAYGRIGLQRIGAQCAQLARMADVVTTTTAQLADKYRQLGAERVVEIPNFLTVDATKLRRSRREELVIGWVAALEHTVDVRRVPIEKALTRILAEHPNVRVESAGVRLKLPKDRYRFHRWIPIEQLQEFLTGWDIGIAPLADIQFNRARSDVKLKEYTASGLCWLASPVGPYRDKGPKQGGRLVADDGWSQALDALIRDPSERDRLTRNGTRWAGQQSIGHAAREWERVCIEAVERRRARAA